MQRKPFTTETAIGTETNKGKFLGFDAHGTAHFVKANGCTGWAGSETFAFVQILAANENPR